MFCLSAKLSQFRLSQIPRLGWGFDLNLQVLIAAAANDIICKGGVGGRERTPQLLPLPSTILNDIYRAPCSGLWPPKATDAFEYVYHPSWPLCVTQVLEDVGTDYHAADSKGVAARALGQLKVKHFAWVDQIFYSKLLFFLWPETVCKNLISQYSSKMSE